MIATHCQGCGTELPPPNEHTRNRKWCSGQCRKAQYSRPCIDCGAPTGGSNGRGPNAALRCGECGQRQSLETNATRHREHRELVEQLWAEGKTCRQIGALFGWSAPSTEISKLRAAGYNLPHRRSPEAVARIAAANRAMTARRVAA